MWTADRARSAVHIAREEDSAWIATYGAMARRHGLWIHTGSAPFLSDDGSRRVNRSHVVAADGSVVARYDKIHMFDVSLPSGENWSESSSYAGGEAPAVVDTPVGRLGLSICYDLRFPELYRALTQRGAELLAIPAAFTVSTGEAHWHVLMRARAIETGCHVLAAAQAGVHADGRSTYGHSLAVGPWGEVLGEAQGVPGEDFALVVAPVDPAATERARQAIPLARSRANRGVDL
ncbi:nitrilase [Sphingopyxis sp. HIX]|uniref:carbon-nitrogen hydrolase family protein n=1 Tax=Sphingopyxis sp. HIX TaxID=1759074 RepID=UPI0007371286|nr:carbon-nitrogen hydrolase family protein [Sphingopyxis sp. HIX]KTE32053.1 nitrilase [Sphingopyxis sp. HIX]